MPPSWQVIRSVREDITDWLIHSTRGTSENGTHVSPLDSLKQILQCGYLKPTFAPRISYASKLNRNTIHGPNPAVCFTDQPLWAFIKTYRTLPERYQPYGIAVPKRNLYLYGGRPVIYGDTNQLGQLHEDEKYLWVRYEPIPSSTFDNYPVDWMHEREWRARIRRYPFLDWKLTPEEGVPLVLPPSPPDYQVPLPIIIVSSREEADYLKGWLAQMVAFTGENGFIKQFYEHRTRLNVVALNMVKEKLEAGQRQWGRLDTLSPDDLV